MRDLPRDDMTRNRRPGIRGSIAPSDHTRLVHPTPAEVFFEIGLTLAAALAIALAGNLLALATGG